MPFKRKLYLLFIGSFVLFFMSVFLVETYQERTSHSASEAINSADRNLRLVHHSNLKFLNSVQAWKNILLRGHDVSERHKYRNEFKAHSEEFEKSLKDLLQHLNPEQSTVLELIVKSHQVALSRYDSAYISVVDTDVFDPVKADSAVKGVDREVTKNLKKLSEVVEQDLDRIVVNSKRQVEQAGSILKIGTLLLCCSIGPFVFIIIRRAVAVIEDDSEKIGAISEEVLSMGTNLNVRAEKIYGSANKQAVSLQKTSSAINQMERMLASTTEGTLRAKVQSDSVLKLTISGLKSMNEVQSSMKLVKNLASRMDEMIRIVAEIALKTKVVNDIVFKTQLLSFNASIEAARAGQHGKGFAVVAEEIGNLAQLSGNAAKDIENLLLGSEQQMAKVAEETHTNVLLAESVCTKAEISFQEICDFVRQIAEQISIISDASTQQQAGVNQVCQAMNSLDHESNSTREQAASTLTASDDLRKQGETLSSLTRQLKFVISGS